MFLRPGLLGSGKWVYSLALIILGALLGAGWAGKRDSKEDQILINSIKFRELLSLINSDYIDETNTDSLADIAIHSLISELDPHSSYLPKKEVIPGLVPLESDFEGIGAEFQNINDTIWVSSVLKGSPSEKAGLKPGHRIIEINKIPVSGVKISNQELTFLVRGPKGTPLQAGILETSLKDIQQIRIIRDRIKSKSIDLVDLPVPGVGFIKCSRFTHSTPGELRESLMYLFSLGMTSLVLDLRDNSGGYVSSAIKVADEFLNEKKLIVYTEGRNHDHNSRIFATSSGLYETGNLVVMINENTASAAEIVAGSLQDHDRALVVGRRSFGKGLVQAPISLTDGSELRLTISRYFTPSGRCIQKGYQRKRRQLYFSESESRNRNGELFWQDSIKVVGKPLFKTGIGRKVYGGGGIIPDLFFSKDTLSQGIENIKGLEKSALYLFLLRYYSENRENLNFKNTNDFLASFDLNTHDFEKLKKLVEIVYLKRCQLNNIGSICKWNLSLNIKLQLTRQKGRTPSLSEI
jgi:carboxyl-terminal processing protease